MASVITRIDDCLSQRDGSLWMEECRLADLAVRFGTPVYVVSEAKLRGNLQRIQAAFEAAWPHGPVCLLPSLKANLSLSLRRILTADGAGCDTFGPGELHAALTSGVPPQLISVNGSSKDTALIERAVAAGARITLDSPRELDLVIEAARRHATRAVIRLRLRPDYAGLDLPSDFSPDLDVATAAGRYKPGIPAEQAIETGARALAAPELRVSGLMAHLGRHSADPRVWRAMGESFAEVIARCCQAWEGWRPGELDVGGGYPSPRDPTAPDGAAPAAIEEYAREVAGGLADGLAAAGVDPAGIALEAEPGRGLYADTGVHLTTVRNIKHQQLPFEWTWVEVDTTEMFLADLLIEHARFAPMAATKTDQPADLEADLVGISCGFDVLSARAHLPRLEPGDVLALLDTGAYQDACAANFNALPRPGTVLVSGNTAEWIKRPETVDEVFARDVIPERLR
ncbi:MAG TPA: alanine racemase [Gaiellales bacterium]|nr:alanine racemase [Gaiellales bacterium]